MVFVTVPDHASALEIARAVVDRRLAACVNVVTAVTSVYRWKGTIREEGEELLVIKTTRDRVAALLDAVTEAHPYEVPEGLVIGVEEGLSPYLEWVLTSVAPAENASEER